MEMWVVVEKEERCSSALSWVDLLDAGVCGRGLDLRARKVGGRERSRGRNRFDRKYVVVLRLRLNGSAATAQRKRKNLRQDQELARLRRRSRLQPFVCALRRSRELFRRTG